jgi:hypothetical protein
LGEKGHPLAGLSQVDATHRTNDVGGKSSVPPSLSKVKPITKFLQIAFSSLLVASLLLTNASPSHADQKGLVQLDPKEVTVNGITILSEKTDIVRILGKPKKVESGFDEPTAEKSETFYYDGVRAYLIGGKIYNLSWKGKSCRTGKGIGIGDAKEKVIAAYGTPSQPQTSSTSFIRLDMWPWCVSLPLAVPW